MLNSSFILTVAISLTSIISEGAQLERTLSLYCSANCDLFPQPVPPLHFLFPSQSSIALSIKLIYFVADSCSSARMHIPTSLNPMPFGGIYCHWKAWALDAYSSGPPRPWLLNTLDAFNLLTRPQSSLADPVGLRVSAVSQAARFLFLLPRA